jgi:hypothetical protein
MPTPENQALLQRQRERLQQLKEDAGDIADALADQLWDRFEVEIEEATEDGFMVDTASMMQSALSATFAMSYQEAFERDVLSIFETLRNQLADAMGEAAIDTARIDLAALRKSLKLRRHAEALIHEAIESAKPGVGRVLGTIVGDLFRDPMQQMDALDNDMKKDAQAVRRALMNLRTELRNLMTEETRQLINLGRLAYADGLEARHNAHQRTDASDRALPNSRSLHRWL